MKTKICRICKQEKNINEFYLRDKKRKIYFHECKKCKNKLSENTRIKNEKIYRCIICGKILDKKNYKKKGKKRSLFCLACRKKNKIEYQAKYYIKNKIKLQKYKKINYKLK